MAHHTSPSSGVGKVLSGCASAVGSGVSRCFKGRKKSHVVRSNSGTQIHVDQAAAFGEGALRYNPFAEEVRSPRGSPPHKGFTAPSRRKETTVPQAKAFGEGALQQWH